MKVVCSYCRKILPEKPPFDDNRISHGACRPCYERLSQQLNDTTLDACLEEFDAPVLVVREDSRILALNRAMESLLGKQSREAFGLLGGEAMECVYAGLPGGCGETVHCEPCTIRRAVKLTMETGEPVVDAPSCLMTKGRRLALRISTMRIDRMVRVVICEQKPQVP